MAEDNLDLNSGTEAPLRLRMGEISTVGLKVSNDRIYEEMKKELRWPSVVTTYKQMGYDATIAAAIELFEMMLIGKLCLQWMLHQNRLRKLSL